MEAEIKEVITNKEGTLEFEMDSTVGIEGFKIKMTPKHRLYRRGMTEEELEGGFVIHTENICPNSWISKGVRVLSGEVKIINSVLEDLDNITTVFSGIKGNVYIIGSYINVREFSIDGGFIKDFTLMGMELKNVVYFKAWNSDISGNVIFTREGWSECQLKIIDSKVNGNLISRSGFIKIENSHLLGNISLNLPDAGVTTFKNSNIMGPKEFSEEHEIINKVDLYE